MDIIVVSEITGFPGCVMDCRLIGALKAEQKERDGQKMRNDRLMGVPVVSQLFSEVSDITDLPDAILNQLEHFFRNYNEQAGKEFKILKRLGAKTAAKLF